MSKTITYRIKGGFEPLEGKTEFLVVDPSWWDGDIKKLVARVEKTPHEDWSGETKREYFRKVKSLEVVRTVVETIARYGDA